MITYLVDLKTTRIIENNPKSSHSKMRALKLTKFNKDLLSPNAKQSEK